MNYNPKHKIFPTNQEMNCIWKIIISNCFGFKSNVSLLFSFYFDIKFIFNHNSN